METFELTALPREEAGKGASRRLRRQGRLPGIVYGAGKETVAISLGHDDLMHHLEHEAFFSHVLTLQLNGKRERVVLKALQRHPWRPVVLHLDLLRVSETEKLTMNVPLHFINEETCVGVKEQGGVISHIVSELEISCLPADLPEYIEIDLAKVELGQTIHLGELRLPDGVENAALLRGGDATLPVASVHVPRVSSVDEEGASDEEAGADEETGDGAGGTED